MIRIHKVTIFLITIILSCVVIQQIAVGISRPQWLEEGTTAKYQMKSKFVEFTNGISKIASVDEEFEGAFSWEVTKISETVEIIVRMYMLNINKTLRVSINSENTASLDNGTVIGLLPLWQQELYDGARNVVISGKNSSEILATVSTNDILFTPKGPQDCWALRADVHAVNETWSFLYDFDKDTGVLVEIFGQIAEPLLRYFGITFMSGQIHLVSTNIDLGAEYFLAYFAPLSLIAIPLIVSVTTVVTIYILYRRAHKKKRSKSKGGRK